MTNHVFRPPLGLNGLTNTRKRSFDFCLEFECLYCMDIWLIDRKHDHFPFSLHMVWLPVEVGRTKIPDVENVGLSNTYIYFLSWKEKGKTSPKKNIYGQTYKSFLTVFRFDLDFIHNFPWNFFLIHFMHSSLNLRTFYACLFPFDKLSFVLRNREDSAKKVLHAGFCIT